jgi:hypothetical protein
MAVRFDIPSNYTSEDAGEQSVIKTLIKRRN